MAESKIGKVVQVIGPVVDIKFDEASLPNIYNEIKIDMGDRELVVEVEQHVGDDIVRAIAMETFLRTVTRGCLRYAKKREQY